MKVVRKFNSNLHDYSVINAPYKYIMIQVSRAKPTQKLSKIIYGNTIVLPLIICNSFCVGLIVVMTNL